LFFVSACISKFQFLFKSADVTPRAMAGRNSPMA
jgi:hypothetical protein